MNLKEIRKNSNNENTKNACELREVLKREYVINSLIKVITS